MKPGEDGGIDPSTCFFCRRRSNAQQPRKSAAAATSPSGIPTPSPTFWPLERPALLAMGESGVGIEEGVADDEGSAVLEKIEDSVDPDDSVDPGDSVDPDDVGFRLESNVVGVVEVDAVFVALLLLLLLLLVPVLVLEGCHWLVSSGSFVVVAVADGHSHPVLAGGSVGHAVCGPKCRIK
jgi:hypothetical protein